VAAGLLTGRLRSTGRFYGPAGFPPDHHRPHPRGGAQFCRRSPQLTNLVRPASISVAVTRDRRSEAGVTRRWWSARTEGSSSDRASGSWSDLRARSTEPEISPPARLSADCGRAMSLPGARALARDRLRAGTGRQLNIRCRIVHNVGWQSVRAGFCPFRPAISRTGAFSSDRYATIED
jgi:hypothetical protein